jgi:tRNA1(Val) A37 N6-methylase TrmN6
MIEYTDGVSIPINEIEGICYVSTWSKFFISKIPTVLDDMVVCDYGAGTGIIGIVAALNGAKIVEVIERDKSFELIMEQNYKQNHVSEKIHVLDADDKEVRANYYDYIFCNPSCYPSIIGNDSFFCAGELGLDMINEVILYASKSLKDTGHLYILIPSLSPISLVYDYLESLGLHAKKVDSTFVAFRKHLCDNLKKWIDDNKHSYPEICYYRKKHEFFEKVVLYDIHFCN